MESLGLGLHPLLKSDNHRTKNMIAKATRVNRERDAGDRAHGFGSPSDCPPEIHLTTVMAALMAGIGTRDWDCVAEAAVMAGDLHRRLESGK